LQKQYTQLICGTKTLWLKQIMKIYSDQFSVHISG